MLPKCGRDHAPQVQENREVCGGRFLQIFIGDICNGKDCVPQVQDNREICGGRDHAPQVQDNREVCGRRFIQTTDHDEDAENEINVIVE